MSFNPYGGKATALAPPALASPASRSRRAVATKLKMLTVSLLTTANPYGAPPGFNSFPGSQAAPGMRPPPGLGTCSVPQGFPPAACLPCFSNCAIPPRPASRHVLCPGIGTAPGCSAAQWCDAS